MDRLKKAKILVIGAVHVKNSVNYDKDNERWSQIDENYIGVSHLNNIYTQKNISWNYTDNNQQYWKNIFEEFNKSNGSKKIFNEIYIDRRTAHNMINNLDTNIYKINEKLNTEIILGKCNHVYNQIINDLHDNVKNTSFGSFIEYIYNNNITNILNIWKESLEIKEVDEDYETSNETKNAQSMNLLIQNSKRHLQHDFLIKYFKYCDESRFIEDNDDTDIFYSYIKKVNIN